MIIVLGGIKGGSGKTTLATNLVVMRSREKKRVLFIDADEQKSASIWLVQRKEKVNWSTIQLFGRNIHSDIEKIQHNYDDIIIDVGGRDTTSQRSALVMADLYLVPFKPRSLDIWTIEDIVKIIEEMKSENENLKSFSIINQGDAVGDDNKQTIDILDEYEEIKRMDVVIGNRKSFANACSDGLGVIEMKKKDAKACDEITQLYNEVYK
jgi:chromosome partitioning protein